MTRDAPPPRYGYNLGMSVGAMHARTGPGLGIKQDTSVGADCIVQNTAELETCLGSVY